MENLPENEWMKELEGRLRNYNEQPDDAIWNAIARTAKPQREVAVWKWLDYAGSAAVVLLAILLLSTKAEKPLLVLKTAEDIKSEKALENHITKAIPLSTLPSEDHAVISISPKIKSVELNVDHHGIAYSEPSLYQEEVVKNSEVSSTTQPFNQPNFNINEKPIALIDTIPNNSNTMPDTASLPVKKEKQEKPLKKKQKKDVALYVQLMPSLSYHAIQPFANDEITLSSFNSSSVLSSDRFGFGGEVGIEGKVSKKLNYLAGLTFYNQKQTLTYQTISDTNHEIVTSISNPFSYSTIPLEDRHTVNYDMTNVGVNAGFLYELKSIGLLHKIGLTGSFQRGLKKSIDGDTYTNAKSSYVFYNVLYRLEYPLNPRFKFYVQPTYSRGFYVNEKLAEPFQLKPSRAGITLGVVIDF